MSKTPNYMIVEIDTGKIVGTVRTFSADRALAAHRSFFPKSKPILAVLETYQGEAMKGYVNLDTLTKDLTVD